MNISKTLKQIIMDAPEFRFRDRRSFYASELTKDSRDLYWKLTGEPETNPSDITGKIRMGLGNAVETYVTGLLQKGHFFGLKFLGTQIPIGGSSPVQVDGYLDGLVEDASGKKHVIEVKSKWGWGASFFCRERNPGDSYLAQMGYYLRDMSAKGVTDSGIFIFVPMGDDTIGDIIAIYCKYNPATGIVTAHSSQGLNDEEPRPHNFQLNVETVLAKLAKVQENVLAGTLPEVDKLYKYPIDQKTLLSASDSDIKKAAANEKVIGDWEISYSGYKQKHMRLQDCPGGYNENELALLNEELVKRETVKRAVSNAKRAATIAAKKGAKNG